MIACAGSGHLEIPAMEFDTKHDCTGVDWKTVAGTLKSVGMAHHQPERHQRAFEASHTTVFIYFSIKE